MGPHGVLETCLWHLVSQQVDEIFVSESWPYPIVSSRDSCKLLTKTPQRPLSENTGLCPEEMLFILFSTLPQLGSGQ